jgi:hypothetical protein
MLTLRYMCNLITIIGPAFVTRISMGEMTAMNRCVPPSQVVGVLLMIFT